MRSAGLFRPSELLTHVNKPYRGNGMKKQVLVLVSTLLLSIPAFASSENREPVPHGSVPKLDHVFVIMMENHPQQEIIGNPNAPFMNQEAVEAGQATNYYGVGHPSLINYLE